MTNSREASRTSYQNTTSFRQTSVNITPIRCLVVPNALWAGVHYRSSKTLTKIVSMHPALRSMVVAQVAGFVASLWLSSEMDITDSKLGSALDKVRLISF